MPLLKEGSKVTYHDPFDDIYVTMTVDDIEIFEFILDDDENQNMISGMVASTLNEPFYAEIYGDDAVNFKVRTYTI